jgi:hypothetical protein
MTRPADPDDPRPLRHDVEVEVTVRVHDSGEEFRASFVERRLRAGTGVTYRQDTLARVNGAAAQACARAVEFVRQSYPPPEVGS